MAFYEIMRLEDLPAESLDRVYAPALARMLFWQLPHNLDEVPGSEDVLRTICRRTGIRWEWSRWDESHRGRWTEELKDLIDQGAVVVVHKRFPPLLPAFHNVDGNWQVVPDVRRHSFRAHDSFTRELEHREYRERERKVWQARNQARTPDVIEVAAGPGSRPTTLGPHETEGGSQPKPASPPVKTGLGEDVDQLAAKSPSLQRDLKALNDSGWEIGYGRPGGGSYADRASRPPKITIDGAQRSNPRSATQTLAHEVGHATYPYEPDVSSKSAFVNGALADEGAATLNNIKVQREILTNGGPDIGIAGNRANHAAYNKTYDQFLKDGNAPAARENIGKQFGQGEITSNTGQPYAEYYGGWYDKAYPRK